MKKLLGMLGSIFISILIIVGAGITLTVIFKDRVPILEEVPEPKEYKALNRREYVVATNGIENAQSATVVYESTNWELEQYGQDLRYISGKIEPLTTLNDPALSADIPTDIFPASAKNSSSSSSSSTVSTPITSSADSNTSAETEKMADESEIE